MIIMRIGCTCTDLDSDKTDERSFDKRSNLIIEWAVLMRVTIWDCEARSSEGR